MKTTTILHAARISFSVFILSHILYSLLTLPFLLMDTEIWMASVCYALTGSALIGLPVFFMFIYGFCRRGQLPHERAFRQSVTTCAGISASLSAVIVTVFFMSILGVSRCMNELLWMPLAGAISPFPVLWLMGGLLDREYLRINGARRDEIREMR